MGNSARLRALALVTAGILGTWSLGGAAVAEPAGDHADHGRHLGQDKGKDKDAKADKGSRKDQDDKGNKGNKDDKATGDKPKGDRGHHHGHAHAPGQQGNPGHHGGQGATAGQGSAFGQGDPAGNNGTVKIAGPGDEVGHPSNNPHPGCTFYVEWFGFDEGADVVSTVSFASQAPTSDVVLGGTAPAQVFVGGDAAGGGTDLDGRQAYTLTFQGEPHPQQGYHVKLTVATPHSLGNDTKTKVFWVEPCADVPPSETPTEAPAPTDTPTTGGDLGVGGLTPETPVSTDAPESSTTDQGVLGETFVAGDNAGSGDLADAATGSAAVPTAVDAGEDGALPGWARSPFPLTLVSFALVLAGAGIVLRNRSRA